MKLFIYFNLNSLAGFIGRRNERLRDYRTAGGKIAFGMMLAMWFLGAAGHSAAAGPMLVQTNTVAVGESRIIAASGPQIVVAKEGFIRLLPIGSGKLVMSGLKAGRTDLSVFDENGQPKEHYFVIVNEPAAAQPPPPSPPSQQTRKIKIYDGGKVSEFEVKY